DLWPERRRKERASAGERRGGARARPERVDQRGERAVELGVDRAALPAFRQREGARRHERHEGRPEQGPPDREPEAAKEDHQPQPEPLRREHAPRGVLPEQSSTPPLDLAAVAPEEL